MIIVDTALRKREMAGKPVRVAMVGAGFMGRGIALQILSVVAGMRLVAISNRHLDGARRAYVEAGVEDLAVVETVRQLEAAVRYGQYAITDDAQLLCQAEGINAILEVTGSIEFAAQVALEAIAHGKHLS
jgi:predicted homoserine dehydrogenase-like protein